MFKSYKASSIQDLLKFLNTGKAGGVFLKTDIIGVYPDSANGGWIVLYYQ